MGGLGRSGLALGVVTAVLLAGCGFASQETELLAAVDRSFSGSFAYTLHVDAEPAAGETDEVGLGSLMRGLEVSGRRVDGNDALVVRVLGFDAFELRSDGVDRVHVRLGLGQLFRVAAGGGVDPSAAMVEALEARGSPREILDTVRAGLDGQWLTVEGRIDTAALERILAGEARSPASETPALRDALCQDLRGFVACFVEVRGVAESGSEQTYDVALDVAELVRRLGSLDPTDVVVGTAEVPERVPGRVVTRDGLIRTVEAELTEVDATGQEGSEPVVRVRLEVRDHGSVEPLPAPERTSVVDAEDFLAALAALMELTEELGARP